MASSKLFQKLMGDNLRAVAPIKVIAVLLSVIAVVWLVTSVAGERWVKVTSRYHEGRTWDWGLWNTCHELQEDVRVCVNEDWLTACLVFGIMSVVFCVAGTICGGLGVRFCGSDSRKTDAFYKAAAGFLGTVALLEFLVVVIFPVKFGEDIQKSDQIKRWDFDWAYGFAWGGLIFSIGASLCYLVPGKYTALETGGKSDSSDEQDYSPG
ncbi:transmembrane protein 47-like [Mya arenaria]|uniref:transmembrane protein 47-like n=1 Tax=Mya arenaria TaxID=6604 RepID=UPI0022E54287|nr:transmembrane protein 47-like [Mya arenaria]